MLFKFEWIQLTALQNKNIKCTGKHVWYDTLTVPKWPRAHWDSILVNIGKQKCNSNSSLSSPGEAVLISQHSRSARSYFSSKIKLGGHWSERQRARWGWAMAALLSDVKISSLTPPSPPPLRWLLKYDELKWEMGVKKKQTEAAESLQTKGKIETVSSAATFKTTAAPLEMH